MDVRLFDLKIMLAWCTLKVATLEREAGEMVRHHWALGYARFLDKPMFFFYVYIYIYYVFIYLHICILYVIYNICVIYFLYIYIYYTFTHIQSI